MPFEDDPLYQMIHEKMEAARSGTFSTPAQDALREAIEQAEAWSEAAQNATTREERLEAEAHVQEWVAYGEQEAAAAELTDEAIVQTFRHSASAWQDAARRAQLADGSRPTDYDHLVNLGHGKPPLAIPDAAHKPRLEDFMNARPDLAARVIEESFERHAPAGWQDRHVAMKLADLDHARSRGELSETALLEAQREIRAWGREHGVDDDADATPDDEEG